MMTENVRDSAGAIAPPELVEDARVEAKRKRKRKYQRGPNDTPLHNFRCPDVTWRDAINATAAYGTSNSAVCVAALVSYTTSHPFEMREVDGKMRPVPLLTLLDGEGSPDGADAATSESVPVT